MSHVLNKRKRRWVIWGLNKRIKSQRENKISAAALKEIELWDDKTSSMSEFIGLIKRFQSRYLFSII